MRCDWDQIIRRYLHENQIISDGILKIFRKTLRRNPVAAISYIFQ